MNHSGRYSVIPMALGLQVAGKDLFVYYQLSIIKTVRHNTSAFRLSLKAKDRFNGCFLG